MSRSPTKNEAPENGYLDAWHQLALRIQQGASFSGHERNCCFLNTGQTQFADASAALGLDHLDDGRALALTDWDHDGDVDLWLANRTGPRVRFMRNEVPSGNHFVALKLEGDPSQGTNRDAIGARVRIVVGTGDSTKVLSQSVTAGDGYLSQSSKWLTFGLGRAARVERASVRWPGQQAFVDIDLPTVNARYLIKQSNGRVVRLNDSRAVRLAASVPQPSSDSGASRLRFSVPPLVRKLEYQSWSGQTVTREMPLPGPLLVTLWSSTCAPCLAEFEEFGQHALTWRTHGLEFLALNVDALNDDAANGDALGATPGGNDHQLPNILAETGFPGQGGFATRELIEQLDQLQRQSVYRQLPLPVPTSFLLDHGGWLRVVYRGVVATEQLEEDLQNLRTTQQRGLALSLPFSGRWGNVEFVSHPVAVAKVQLEDGYPDEARAYLQKYLDENPVPTNPHHDAESRLLARRLADVNYQLSVIARIQGERDSALEHLNASLKLYPNLLPALLDMADAMKQRDNLTRADRLLSHALEVAPRDPLANTRMGELRMRQGRASAAVPHFELAIRSGRWFAAANNLAWIRATHPDKNMRHAVQAIELARRVCKRTANKEPAALDTLAAALAAAGQFEEAAGWADRATQLARSNGNAVLAEAVAGRAELYRAGRIYVDESLQQ